jgi:hypothetical protein
MKKYHYSEGDNQFGPLTIEELKDKKITKDTMVWYEGLDNWVKAGDVDELKERFKSTPPPLSSTKQTPPPINVKTEKKSNPTVTNVKPKKNKTGLAVGLIGGVIAIALIVFFVINNNQSNSSSNNNNNGSDTHNTSSNNLNSESTNQQNNYTPPPPKKKTEEELKSELANTECANPVKYLKMNNKDLTGVYKNALSMKFNGFKVKFNVQNTATIVTFKNVKCRVTLSSNSGSTILTKNFIVPEFIRAGSYVSYKGEFECTNQQFKDTDRYSIEILGAECH